jgi:hypothetical protein
LRIYLKNAPFYVNCGGWERRRLVCDRRDQQHWLERLDRAATSNTEINETAKAAQNPAHLAHTWLGTTLTWQLS